MKFNGKRIKEDEKYQKHIAYKISKTRSLSFNETQQELIIAKSYLHSLINIEKDLEILKNFKKMVFYMGKEKFTFDYKKLEENNFYRFKMKY